MKPTLQVQISTNSSPLRSLGIWTAWKKLNLDWLVSILKLCAVWFVSLGFGFRILFGRFYSGSRLKKFRFGRFYSGSRFNTFYFGSHLGSLLYLYQTFRTGELERFDGPADGGSLAKKTRRDDIEKAASDFSAESGSEAEAGPDDFCAVDRNARGVDMYLVCHFIF